MKVIASEVLDALPEPPEGWQYGVVMQYLATADGKEENYMFVWGCGVGEDGRYRQRMRLHYDRAVMPCLLPVQPLEYKKER